MRNFGQIQYSGWGVPEISKAGAIPTAQELRNWAVGRANAERMAAGSGSLDAATIAGADEWVGKVNKGEMTVLGMATEFVKGLNSSGASNTSAELQQMIQAGTFSPNAGNGNGNGSRNGAGNTIIPSVPDWATYTGAGVVTLGLAFWIISKLR